MTAIDLTENAVKMTKINAESRGLKFAILRMDAEKTSFGPDSFDCIFSWGVIHLTANPEAVLREMYRLLKKGGHAFIMVYNRLSFRYYLQGLYWLVVRGKIFSGYSLESVQHFFTDGYYHKHYSKKELISTLEKAGFRVNVIYISHMAKKMLPLIPKWADEYLKTRYGWFFVAEFTKA